MLNIIRTNENAETSGRSGSTRWGKFCRRRRIASIQKGVAPAYIATQVEGLRYPSGMCISDGYFEFNSPFGCGSIARSEIRRSFGRRESHLEGGWPAGFSGDHRVAHRL